MKNTRSTGFTSIELLVVIAIIAILAAILFPVFAQAREKARQTTCLSNMKQIGTSLFMYAQDNDEEMPGYSEQPPINNGMAYALGWDQQILPYLKNYQVFACPSDSETRNTVEVNAFNDGNLVQAAQKRSYGFVAPVATIEGGLYYNNTGLYNQSLASAEQPSDTILLTESWPENSSRQQYVGSRNSYCYLFGCTWMLAGRIASSAAPQEQLPGSCSVYLTSKPTRGHAKGSNYLNADSSVKFRTWGQVRKNDFYLFKRRKPTAVFTP